MMSPGKTATQQIRISRVELFLIATLLILGSIVILMTPLGAGYDEDQHLNRVWQMANLRMVPKEMSWRQSKFPQLYIELSYRKQPLVESVGFDYWAKYGNLKLNDHGFYYGSLDTRSQYNPLLFLPQAFVLRYSAWRFEFPALTVYYATRFAGLITYIFLVWLAVRVIPFGKWTLISLSIAPMAIYQASTISADTITNGIGFLFIGGTLAIANKHEIRFKEWGMLILLIAALFLTKPNIYPLVLLPFLLIAPSRFVNRFSYPLLILCSIIVFGIIVIGWNTISPNPGFNPSGNVNIAEQIKYILSSPLAFPQVLLNDLIIGGSTYLKQWIGVYGYDYGSVPTITYFFFLAGILLTLFVKDHQIPDRKTRVILLLVFLLCYIATSLSLYVTYTTVGERFVYGIQGRYFIPVLPLLFLALGNIPCLSKLQSSILVTTFFSLIAAIVFIGGLILTYHVTCGPAYYTTGLCYQPFYKNLSPLTVSSPPVSDGTILIQEIAPVCNGMTEIQVRVNSPGNAPNGKLEFVLRNKRDNSILIQQTVNNRNLPEDTWYGIGFSPDWKSAGQLYTLSLRGINSTVADGPLLAYSIRPEYPLGILLENGKPLEDDVIFRYGCLVGLQKIWQEINP